MADETTPPQPRFKIVEPHEASAVARALDSPLRRRILELVYDNPLSISQLAEMLGIPNSTCTLNVQILRKANLLEPQPKGRKLCCTHYQELAFPIAGAAGHPQENAVEIEMPIGMYSRYKAGVPCGLASEEKIIGFFDVPSSFLDPQRASAQLIWLSNGWLEYPFSRTILPGERLKSLSVTAEVCSEYSGSKNDWPSDITVWVNGTEIGTWTCPGDIGGVRGRLTPQWWGLHDTQYGFRKTWRVSGAGCFIDGVRVSDTTIDGIDTRGEAVIVRIGVKEDAEHNGGLNVFGRRFGNWEHDIVLRMEVERGA